MGARSTRNHLFVCDEAGNENDGKRMECQAALIRIHNYTANRNCIYFVTINASNSGMSMVDMEVR